MEHVTIGKKFGEGKIAYAECVTETFLGWISRARASFWSAFGRVR